MKKLLLLFLISGPVFAVNYPVADNARFVVYDTTLPGCTLNAPECLIQVDNRPKRHPWPSTDRTVFPADWPPNITYLEVLRPASPAFDPLIEKIERSWVIDRAAGEYRREANIVALTQQEIDDNTANQEAADNQNDCATRPTPGIRADRQAMRNGSGNQAARIRRLEDYMVRIMGCLWPNRVGPVQ